MPNDPQSQALRWLAQRSLTVWEIRVRLEARNFSQESIAAALTDLMRLGYLDDRRVAEEVVQKSLNRREGPLHLLSRLQRRGVPKDVRDAVLGEVMTAVDWLEIAELVRQRYDIGSPGGRAQFVRHLAREGFPVGVIQQLADDGERGDHADGVEDY
jgi:SOS response regulatory protein OraA/RecX